MGRHACGLCWDIRGQQGWHDDEVAFEPHSDVDQNTRNQEAAEREFGWEHNGNHQQDCWQQEATAHYPPPCDAVRALPHEDVEQATVNCFTTIPSGKVFGQGEVKVDYSQCHEQRAKGAELAHGDEIFQVICSAENRHRHDEGSGPGVNGADDEVRAENRAVPARAQCHPENPGDDRVHRHGHGNNNYRHSVHGAFQQMLLFRRAAIAERSRAIKPL
jgi:hypothetical protein